MKAAFAPAQAHGRHLFAANDPLSAADRELAAKFAGPADAFPLADTTDEIFARAAALAIQRGQLRTLAADSPRRRQLLHSVRKVEDVIVGLGEICVMQARMAALGSEA